MFKRFLVAVAAVAVLVGGSSVAQSAPTAATTPVPQYMVDGCIIRFPTATPEILDTGGHVCSPRVTGVSVAANGDLLIHHTPVAGIVSATVAADETLTARGISGGPSVGWETTTVRLYSSRTGGLVRADGPEVRGANANIFVTWVSVPAAGQHIGDDC